ncbi:IS3 family transposase [Collinsella aerofaciens]|uniref:IS3 family transposase n=1 Tax=Collinsella aerofaciens TaxID=74426 RepID=UPI0034A252D5
MLEVYEAGRCICGSPKVFQVLKRDSECVSRKRVARIMRGNGWRGVTRRCTKDPEKEKRASEGESAPDPVKRDFSADGPDRARFVDITSGPIRAGCTWRL